MAHRNREKRAAKKAQKEARAQERFKEDFYDDYDDDYEDGYDDYYDDGEDYGPPRKRRGPHPAIIAVIITVVVLFVGYYTLEKSFEKSLLPVNPGNETGVMIEIPNGSSTTGIARILKDHDLISNELFFRIHCKRMEYDGQFKQGYYTLTKSMSVDDIAEALIKGTIEAETKRFTIPEGYNIKQIAKSLSANGIVSEMDFYDEVKNGDFHYDFLADCPPGDERLEGFLYPETYEVYADATAHDVVDKMLAQFDELFKVSYYDRARELGMSVRDIVTMGSIVERESVRAEERPLMAGVFYNRIEQDMRLESCATIQFILGEPKEFLTNEDTQIESPYNTYLHEGLPPGPICNPRMASIEAALFPDENDYVFFVLSAELDGSHRFSADYNEFLVNKDAYYAAVEGR